MSSSLEWLITDSALYFDDYSSVFYIVCAAIGIPANAIVVVAIVGLRRLHLHRTFTWLGIGFANILILTFYLLKIFTNHVSNPVVNQICAWLSMLSGPFLVISWLLSLLERYLCLKHPHWYKRNITSCWAILVLQAGSFIILCLGVIGRYFFSSLLFRWQGSVVDFKFIGSFVVAGCIISLGGQVALLTVSNRNYPPAIAVANWIALHPRRGVENENLALDNVENGNSNPFVIIDRERVSRLDLEAARNAAISFGALLILALPNIVSLILLALCLDQSPSSPLIECDHWVKSFFYCHGLIAIYCFCISPAIFIYLSRDFRSALRDRGLLWL